MSEKENQIPRYVAEQYVGGSRGFKSAKRQALRQMEKALGDLRMGCAYFPTGMDPVDDIAERIQYLKRELSIEKWGR